MDHSDEGRSDISCRHFYKFKLGFNTSRSTCPNDFTCRATVDSAVCLPSSSICDGNMDCPYNDDESMCESPNCPDGCMCSRFSFKCNFSNNILGELPIKTRSLDFALTKVDFSAFQQIYLPLLIHLNLSHGRIERLPETETLSVSLGCENLQTFDLSFNNISHIPSRRFQRMLRLRHLYLQGNPIQTIEDFAFSDLNSMRQLSIPDAQIDSISRYALDGLDNLVYLNFSNNLISWMDDMIFSSTPKLEVIDLSHNNLKSIGDHFVHTSELEFLNLSFNEITHVHDFSLHRLEQLRELHLEGNKLTCVSYALLANTLSLEILNLSRNDIHDIAYGTFKGHSELLILDIKHNQIEVFENMFLGLVNLKHMYVDWYTLCCAKPDSVDPEHCHSPQDQISSCDFLIKEIFLSVGIWFLTLFAVVGNIFVLVFRWREERWKKMKSHIIFILNLGFSDLLMGIYLFIIAYKDSEFRGVYGFKDREWRNSGVCSFAGILATISSESSAMFIFFISIDRLIGIKYPLSRMRFTRKDAITCSAVVWGISIAMAVIPTIFVGYFQGQFYSASGVCISLPLTNDLKHGYGYSVFIFICFNFVIFSLVCVAQILIFREMRNSRKRIIGSSTANNRETAVAKSLFAVVLTDVLCWVPIAILGEWFFMSLV